MDNKSQDWERLVLGTDGSIKQWLLCLKQSTLWSQELTVPTRKEVMGNWSHAALLDSQLLKESNSSTAFDQVRPLRKAYGFITRNKGEHSSWKRSGTDVNATLDNVKWRVFAAKSWKVPRDDDAANDIGEK
jgi:hypothetical protein